MNVNESKEIIAEADILGDVPLLIGKHGIGKSEAPEQYAAENNMHYEPLILSLMDTGDLLGMPDNKDVGGLNSTIWNAPSWYSNIVNAAWPQKLKTKHLIFNDPEFESFVKSSGTKKDFYDRGQLNEAYCEFYSVPNDRLQLLRQSNVTYELSQRSLLNLDEFNRALVDILNASLQLILTHRLHSHELPIVNGQETLIVAAVNPADGNYSVQEFDPALMDRFLECHIEADFKAWKKDYADPKNVNKVVVDFLIDNQKKFHFEPADGSKGASPRSWVKLAKYIDRIQTNKMEINTRYVIGTVGSSLAAQFITFYSNYETGLNTEKLVAQIKKEIKSAGKDANVEDISKNLEKTVKGIEAVRRLEFVDALMSMYIKKETAKEAMPLLVYMYALPLESLASALKSLRNTDINNYANLAILDKEANNKGLFLRIVSKTTEE